MKKIISICMLIVMLISILSSCGVKNTNSSTDTKTNTETSTDSNTETETDTSSDTNTSTSTETNSETETNTDTSSDTNTNTTTNSELNTDTNNSTDEMNHVYEEPTADNIIAKINDQTVEVAYCSTDAEPTYTSTSEIYKFCSQASYLTSQNTKSYSVKMLFDKNVVPTKVSSSITSFALEKCDEAIYNCYINPIENNSMPIIYGNELTVFFDLKYDVPRDIFVVIKINVCFEGGYSGDIVLSIEGSSPKAALFGNYPKVTTNEDYLVGRYSYIKNKNAKITLGYTLGKISIEWQDDKNGELVLYDLAIPFSDEEYFDEIDALCIGHDIYDIFVNLKCGGLYSFIPGGNDDSQPITSYHFFKNYVYAFEYQDGVILEITRYVL